MIIKSFCFVIDGNRIEGMQYMYMHAIVACVLVQLFLSDNEVLSLCAMQYNPFIMPSKKEAF